MRTIAIVNQKGGCGKTTTAINLAAVYAERGERTLLVDMDPQAHCGAGLGVPEAQIEVGLAEALLADHDERFDRDALPWEVARNLHLFPSTMRLAGLEAPGGGLHRMPDKDRRLSSLLELYRDRFDCVLVDCPPTLGILTFNALRAAREALIPVETGYFAMKGAQRQWSTIQRTIELINRPIACHLLPTLHKPDMQVARDILARLQRDFAGQIVPLVIRDHDALREAASFGQHVLEHAPQSAARHDFEALADWLDEHCPALNANDPRDAADRAYAAADDPRGGDRGGSGGRTCRVANDAERPAPVAVSRAAELARRVRDRGEPSVAGRPAPASADAAAAAERMEPPEVVTVPAAMDRARVAVTATDSRGGTAPVPQAATPPLPTRSVPFDAPVRRATDPAAGQATATGAPATLVAEIAGRDERPPPKVEHLYGARPTSQGVLFVQPGSAGRSLAVAGDFNAWSPTANPLRYNRELDIYQAIVPVPPGVHRYRLVADGLWQADPYNPAGERNEYGEPNSVVTIEDPGDRNAARADD